MHISTSSLSGKILNKVADCHLLECRWLDLATCRWTQASWESRMWFMARRESGLGQRDAFIRSLKLNQVLSILYISPWFLKTYSITTSHERTPWYSSSNPSVESQLTRSTYSSISCLAYLDKPRALRTTSIFGCNSGLCITYTPRK